MSGASDRAARGLLMQAPAIPVTWFRGVADHTTRGAGKRSEPTWDALAAVLTKHDRRTDKSGRGWTPATFADAPCACGRMKDGKIICPGERGHRTDENVIAVHALTLDIDKTRPDERGKRHQLDQAGAELALARLRDLGLRHIAHSTHSHAPPAVACYRVVVALSRSIPGADFERFWRAALAYLDIPHDPASKNAARFWYRPSCPPDATPIAVVHDGRPLDVDMVMAIARLHAAEAPTQAPRPAARTPRDGDFDGLEFMAIAYPGVHADDFGGGSTVWDIACPWESEHTSKGSDRDTIVTRYADGKMGFKCLHAHCQGRPWKDFRRFHQPERVPFDERPQQPSRARRSDRTPPKDAPSDIPPPGDGDVPPKRRIFTDDPRPEIVLSPDQPAIADAALAALATMGGVYVRGRQLVHVVRDRGGLDWFKRPQGAPAIIPVEREHLSDLLGRAAVWLRIDSKTGQATRTSPPPWVAGRLLARGQWELPQLESVSDAPVFRADGTIHDAPGYDERTRVIYEPNGAEFPPIPAAPTRADAGRALAELLEPFEEFPFRADCDRAACAALVLSVIGRAAVDGNVPMFVAQAPTPGSGKGLLVNVAAMIATGRQAPTMAPTETDDEMRKRLLAIAMDSPSLVVIDNVDAGLGSPSLAMALTTGEVTDRQLGATKMVTASLRPVWAVTGNNVQLRGDLGRRVVPIDLDPKVEHPEDRVFQRGDLLGYVRMQRERLAVAALTVLRAFVVDECRAHGLPAMGSFEAWDRLVRGAIIWASGADPLGGRQRIRDQADEDLDRLRTLLAAWHAEIGGVAVTLAEAIKRAGDSGDLFDAFAAYCRSGKPEAKPLGYALRRIQGRMVNGRAFRRWGSDRNDVALWKIAGAHEVDAGDAGDAGDVSSPVRESGSDPKNGDAREDGPHDPHDPQSGQLSSEYPVYGWDA